MYIAIEGVIGVGKTTLARLLQPGFENSELLLEVFEEKSAHRVEAKALAGPHPDVVVSVHVTDIAAFSALAKVTAAASSVAMPAGRDETEGAGRLVMCGIHTSEKKSYRKLTLNCAITQSQNQ